MAEKKLDVAIIDYKMSNMFSVQSACNHVGLYCEITADKRKILSARSAILPGVGAFSEAMDYLEDLGLIHVIKDFVDSGKPFIGICLGMQLLFSESEEFGLNKGLNIIPGVVKKLPHKDREGKHIKVPQIGWNRIHILDAESHNNWFTPPLSGIRSGEYMYFVHSFYAIPCNNRNIVTVTEYGGIEYCSSASHKNIFACQFHPEKSAKEGLKIYRNLCKTLKREMD